MADGSVSEGMRMIAGAKLPLRPGVKTQPGPVNIQLACCNMLRTNTYVRDVHSAFSITITTPDTFHFTTTHITNHHTRPYYSS